MQLEEHLKANFVRQLACLRDARKLSQAALAQELNRDYAIGLTRTALANYESGKAFPKIPTLYALAKYFGTTIDALLEETPGAPAPANSPESLPAPTRVDGPVSNELPRTLEGRLLKEHAKLLEIQSFYVSLYHDYLHELNEHPDQITHGTQAARLFKQFYLANLLSKSRAFEDGLRELLDNDERMVFQAIQSGSSVSLLAEMQQLPEAEIIRLFVSARQKILAHIDEIQK